MENFFYNDDFHRDLDTLISTLDLDDDGAIENLEDDWEILVELSDLEPIIQFDSEMLLDLVQDDRMSEDGDEMEKLEKVLKKHNIDFSKINEEIPKLHYGNGVKEKITKADLLEYIK